MSGQSLGAPPSYEDIANEGRSPDDTPPPPPTDQEAAVSNNSVAPPPPAAATTTPTSNNENDGFDFFDPRGATPGKIFVPHSLVLIK